MFIGVSNQLAKKFVAEKERILQKALEDIDVLFVNDGIKMMVYPDGRSVLMYGDKPLLEMLPPTLSCERNESGVKVECQMRYRKLY